MRFVLDENLSPDLAVLLKALGEDVIHITKRWKAGTKDKVWLPRVGELGWTVVSFDREMMRNKVELRLYKQHNVGGFLLAGRNAKGIEIARQLLHSWELIKELAEATQRPFYIRLPIVPSVTPGFRNKVANLIELE